MSGWTEDERNEDRLVQLMVDEGKRFDAESAWREREFPKHERERRQLKIVLSEMRVMSKI